MRRGLKVWIGIVIALMTLSACAPAADVESDIKVIGVLQLVEHPALDAALSGLSEYLLANGYDESKVRLDVRNAGGQPANADLIAKEFVSEGVDLIYAIATPAAQAAYNATMGTDIPVVFNAVTDAVAAGIVKSNESPDTNVTGVTDAAPLTIQLQLIREILPNATKIGMLYNLGEVNGKIQVEQVQVLAPALGFEVVVIGVTTNDEIAAGAGQLASEVDCIYNITDNLVVGATAIIVDKANAAGIPVFAAEDGQMSSGLLAVDGLSYAKLGTQAGPIVVDILFNGKSPAQIAVSGATDTQLTINTSVAKTLGITIPEALLSRAALVE